jgi:flagella basal body P-ring formation protein FlgA
MALAAALLWGAAAIAAETTEVPVLAAPKSINDVITADDLVMQEFPAIRIKGDMIRDSKQIIGMAAKRQLSAGRPLRLIDLRREQLVQRGDLVTLTYRQESLEISANGKAMESGALDDTIRVTNATSNRTVDAKVVGPKQVEIR